MRCTEQLIKSEKFNSYICLAWCGEKYKFDALSDFERFAFVCESSPLFLAHSVLDMLGEAMSADTRENMSISPERPLERKETIALWQRIFSPDAPPCRECVPASENTAEGKHLLEKKCSELYRRSKERVPNCFGVEEKICELKQSENAFPKDTDGMADMLVREWKVSGAEWLSVDFRDRQYIRPDAYRAEKIYKSIASDENYKNTNENEMLTLSVWLLCRAMMKSELSPCIYINNSEELKIMLDLLTRLKLARKMTLCIEQGRLDSRFQQDIAALAADYPQSIRIRLLCDGTTERNFISHTQRILHTLPIASFV